MSDADVRSRKRKLCELSEHESSPHYSPPLPQPSQRPSKPPLVISSLEQLSKVDPKPETAIKEPSHPRAPFNKTPQQAEPNPISPKRSAIEGPGPPSIAAPVSTHSQPQSQTWLLSWLEESADRESPDQPISLPSSPQPPASPPSLEAVALESPGNLSPSIPLTARNLRIHNSRDMSSNLQGKKTSGSSSHQPKNLTLLHTELLMAHMMTHKSGDWNEFQETIKKCKSLVLDDSKGSVMSDTSAKKALEENEQWHDEETSFLIYFVIGAVVKLNAKALIQTCEDQVDKTWAKSGICGVADRLFITNCMAGLSKIPKEKLSNDPNLVLTTPKPDLAYGFSIQSFSKEENLVIGDYVDLFRVCPKLVSVFFIIECKAYSQSIDNAEVQVSRGAAALLCAQRQLDVLTGSADDENRVDQRSRVFSMTINPQVARLNVNWVVNENGVLWYYLHRVRIYQLHDLEEVKKLRRDIWSVIDWGLEFHRPKVLKTIEALKSKDKDTIWLREDASSPSKKRRASRD